MNDFNKIYWDKQTTKNGYCELFSQEASKNNWLGMMEKALKKTKVTNFKNILEIGGGSQFLSRYFCEKYPNAKVLCTDISGKRLDVFQNYYVKKPTNLTLIGNVNAEQLSFADGEFDLIIGDAIISQLQDCKKGLLEINRCLAKNGHAIFIREPVVGYFNIFACKLFQLMNKKSFFEKYRPENKKFLNQWIYDFMLAGLKVKAIGGWNSRKVIDRIKSIFPKIFPCFIIFILEKKFDLDHNNIIHK